MDPITIILFILLFLLSAFFSWTELALMSLPEHKIDSFVKKWRFWSKSLKKIRSNNDKLLITILIWNNLVNVYTATLATTIAITIWESMWLAQATVIWYSTWIVTFLLLIFWEIVPKSFATKNASKISLLVAPIYKFLLIILFPVIIFIELITKIFSCKNKKEKITDEELESFIEMWMKSWTIEEWEHKKIKNILELEDTIVEEIMTPRVKIEALSSEKTIWEALDFYLTHTHSRIPIYNETIDKIYSFITSREILLQVKNWNLNKKLSELELNNVMKIPINLSLSRLLDDFQKSHKIMAIVMDEYGWVSWLITLEDILEEVFGEIRDETDKEVEYIKKISKTSLIVSPDVLVEDILEDFSLELNDIWLDEREFWWETLSYLITHELERYPKPWEIISFKIIQESEKCKDNCKIEFKVTSIEDHIIWNIEVKKIKEIIQ
jgi:CBS domain containing-hemolysin-like protein